MKEKLIKAYEEVLDYSISLIFWFKKNWPLFIQVYLVWFSIASAGMVFGATGNPATITLSALSFYALLLFTVMVKNKGEIKK